MHHDNRDVFSKKNGEKTPLALKGGKTDNITIEPITPSTLGTPNYSKDNLFAAKYTTPNGIFNIFQYTNYDVSEELTNGYQKIVLEFDEKVAGGWYLHAYGNGQEPYYSLEGLKKYELELTASTIEDFTIFNIWNGSTPITVTGCYFSKQAATFTVGNDGWATCASTKAVSFGEGVEAYTAKVENDMVNLTKVSAVPAGTAVIVKAAAGTYEFNYEESAETVDNQLQISNGRVEANGTIYVLANGTSGVGFYKLAEGNKVPAGKAYITIAGESREFIAFNDEATAIKSVETENANGAIYNLAGQQVKNAQKGIFIMNGKKVIK